MRMVVNVLLAYRQFPQQLINATYTVAVLKAIFQE